MLTSVPDKLLVRRLHAGDCEALRPLHERVAECVQPFCENITGNANSAIRISDEAFSSVALRLASQKVSTRDFELVLLEDARARSYDAITQRVELGVLSSAEPAPEPIDLDRLCSQVQEVRPSRPVGMGLHMTARSRLRPATALLIGLILVMMADLVAIGNPFNGDDPHKRHAATHEVAAGASGVPVASVSGPAGTQPSKSHPKRAASRSEKGSNGSSSTTGNSDTTVASGSPSESSSGQVTDEVNKTVQPVLENVPKLPPVELPTTVDPPSVQVEAHVEAGPVKVDVDQGLNACVAGICTGTK